MTLKFVLPHPLLRPFIKQYMYLQGSEHAYVQRIVPNGAMGLQFYRNQAVEYRGMGRMRSSLGGPRMHYLDVCTSGALELLSVEFIPYGARMFFKCPITDFFNYVPTPQELGDRDMVELEERIMLESDVDRCFGLLDRFFLQRLYQNNASELNFRRIREAVLSGQRHIKDVRATDMASSACLSPKHFTRIFYEYVGLSPKNYLRLFRIHNAISCMRRLKAGNRDDIPSLTQLSWQWGYYDLSHMNADFQSLCGYSPGIIQNTDNNHYDPFSWLL